MPNLLQTIQELNSVATPAIKTKSELLIEASSSRHSAKFIFAKIDLAKVPLLAVGDPEGPLVIDINASGLRKTKSGFMPQIIIMSGSDKARAAKKNGTLICEAWIGNKILSNKKYSILAAGEAVDMSVLNAPYGDRAVIMEKLLDKPNNGPALGGFTNGQTHGGYDVQNYGAPSSELNNPMLRLMLNVEEALAAYQKEKADGVHKVVYTPYAQLPPGLVNAGREAKIAASVAGLDLEKFSVMDFLKWQHTKCTMKAAMQVKNINGKELKAEAFAYVGDAHDFTTWQARVDSIEQARLSLSELKANGCIPREDKKDVLRIINLKLASYGGSDMSMTAGGPGSGRHSGSGLSKYNKSQIKIAQKGFEHHRTLERKYAGNKGVRSAHSVAAFHYATARDAYKANDADSGDIHMRRGEAAAKQANSATMSMHIKSEASKGKSAKKHLDKITTKKIGAVAPPMTQSITSGGPGSGRHSVLQGPGRFNSANDYAHKTLLRQGYVPKGKSGNYVHKDTGAKAKVTSEDVSHSDKPHARITYN